MLMTRSAVEPKGQCFSYEIVSRLGFARGSAGLQKFCWLLSSGRLMFVSWLGPFSVSAAIGVANSAGDAA